MRTIDFYWFLCYVRELERWVSTGAHAYRRGNEAGKYCPAVSRVLWVRFRWLSSRIVPGVLRCILLQLSASQ